MATNYRYDYFNAPSGRFGTPITNPITSNNEDVLIVHDVALDAIDYQRKHYGFPRPNDKDARLVFEQVQVSNEGKKFVRRIYCTDRVANQDLFNYVLTFNAASAEHPIFVRSYIERRSEFVPRTRSQPLKAVYRIRLTAEGSAYTKPPVVTITDGTGTGATAVALLNEDGTLNGIKLTRGGDNYSTTPSVSITRAAGDTTGTGATATAYVQPANCLLIDEKTEALDNSADDQLKSLYWRVIRIYSTVSGPVLSGQEGVSTNRLLMRHITDDVKVTSKQSPVPPGTAAPRSFLLVASAVTGDSTTTATLETSAVDHFSVLYNKDKSQRAEGLQTITTEEIVPPGTEPLPWVYGRIQSRCDAVGSLRSLRTTETLVPVGGLQGSPKNIVGVTNQSPDLGTAMILQVTSHGYSTGMTVLISGTTGYVTEPAINGYFTIEVIDSNNFRIPGYAGTIGTGGTVQQAIPAFPVLVDPAELDKNSLILSITTRQKLPPSSVAPGLFIVTGSGATATSTLTGGMVTGTTVTAAGTGYANVVGISFGVSPTGNTAMGYGLASGGQVQSVVITNPGSGYVSAPAVTVLPSSFVEVKQVDIDIAHSWKITRVSTQGPYNSSSTAKVSYEDIAYQFPGRITPIGIQDSDLSGHVQYEYFVGHTEADAKLVVAKVLEWWEFHLDPPGTPTWDEIITDTVTLIGREYHHVLHDTLTDAIAFQFYQQYSSSVAGVPLYHFVLKTYTATTPTKSDYESTWIGNYKVIAASIVPDNLTPGLYRFRQTLVKMR